MKNTHAWAIIAVVFVVALGTILYMMNKVDSSVPGANATSTVTGGTTQGTKGTVKGSTSGGTVTAGGTTASTDTRPKILSIAPSSGKGGTVAAIKGMNFDAKTNVITFGPSKGLHHQDGTPDNQIESLPSSDGKTLTFTVPQNGPNGNLCDQNNKCLIYSTDHLKAGTYAVTVFNQNGLSNEMMFTVTD